VRRLHPFSQKSKLLKPKGRTMSDLMENQKSADRNTWLELKLEVAKELSRSLMFSANCPQSEPGVKVLISAYIEELSDLPAGDVLAAIIEIRRGDWEFGPDAKRIARPIGGPYAPRIAEIRHVVIVKSEIRSGKRPSKPAANF